MKKRFLMALLAISMTFSLTACGKTETKRESSNELTVWCWDATFNIPAVDEAEKIYKKSNPDVDVNVV